MPNEQLGTGEAFEQRFFTEHARQVERFRRMGDRAMLQFVFVRLGLVIGSAALPALTTIDARGWLIAASIFVASLAGLDTQFQWGQEWQHFRAAEMALRRAKREYDHQKDLIGRLADETKRLAAAEANFESFYQITDKISEAEAQEFWRFRITKWHPER